MAHDARTTNWRDLEYAQVGERNLGLPRRGSRNSESRVLPPPRPAFSAHGSLDVRPELAHGGAAVPLDSNDRSHSPVQLRGRTETQGGAVQVLGSLRASSPQRSKSPSQRSKSPLRSVSMQESRAELQAEIERMKHFGLPSVSFPAQMPSSLAWGSNSAAAKARASSNAVQEFRTTAGRSQSPTRARDRSQSLRVRSKSPITRQQSHAGTLSAPFQGSSVRTISPQRSQSHNNLGLVRTLSRGGSSRMQMGNSRNNSWQEVADNFLSAYKAMTAAANAATLSSVTSIPSVMPVETQSVAIQRSQSSELVVTASPQVPQRTVQPGVRTSSLHNASAIGVAPSTLAAMTNAANAAANRTAQAPPQNSRSLFETAVAAPSIASMPKNAMPQSGKQPSLASNKMNSQMNAFTTTSSNNTQGEKPEKIDLQQAGEVATAAISSLANLALASIRSLSGDPPQRQDTNPDRARKLSNNLAFRPGAPAQRQFTYGSSKRGSSPSRSRDLAMVRGSSPSRSGESASLTRSLSPSRNREPQLQIPGSLQLKPPASLGTSVGQMQRATSPSRLEQQRGHSPGRTLGPELSLLGVGTSTQRTTSPQRLNTRASFASQPVVAPSQPGTLPSLTSFASQQRLVFPPPSREVSGTVPIQTVDERGTARTAAPNTAAVPTGWKVPQTQAPPMTRQLNQPPQTQGETRYLEQLRAAISRIEQDTAGTPLPMPDLKALMQEQKGGPPPELTTIGPLDCDPRIQAMYEATTPNPEFAAGQEEPDWADVVQYWRGVGGTALRSMGLSQEGVRNLGLV